MPKSILSNVQIVLVAVARLGGTTRFIHTEDVAIEAFNLAPGRFGWRKYPDRIDLDQVRRALARSTKAKPPFVVGNVQRGWMLSKDGLRWIDQHKEEMPALAGYRRGSITDVIEIERARLRETSAWRKLKEGMVDQVNLNDLFEFARINEYFSSDKQQERVNIVSSAVDGDPELASLWRLLQERFANDIGTRNE